MQLRVIEARKKSLNCSLHNYIQLVNESHNLGLIGRFTEVMLMFLGILKCFVGAASGNTGN